MITILALSGIVTIGIGVIKTTKSFFLENGLEYSRCYPVLDHGNAGLIIR